MYVTVSHPNHHVDISVFSVTAQKWFAHDEIKFTHLLSPHFVLFDLFSLIYVVTPDLGSERTRSKLSFQRRLDQSVTMEKPVLLDPFGFLKVSEEMPQWRSKKSVAFTVSPVISTVSGKFTLEFLVLFCWGGWVFYSSFCFVIVFRIVLSKDQRLSKLQNSKQVSISEGHISYFTASPN